VLILFHNLQTPKIIHTFLFAHISAVTEQQFLFTKLFQFNFHKLLLYLFFELPLISLSFLFLYLTEYFLKLKFQHNSCQRNKGQQIVINLLNY